MGAIVFRLGDSFRTASVDLGFFEVLGGTMLLGRYDAITDIKSEDDAAFTRLLYASTLFASFATRNTAQASRTFLADDTWPILDRAGLAIRRRAWFLGLGRNAIVAVMRSTLLLRRVGKIVVVGRRKRSTGQDIFVVAAQVRNRRGIRIVAAKLFRNLSECRAVRRGSRVTGIGEDRVSRVDVVG